MITYRIYTPQDYQFLREMLFEAVFWSRSDENRPSFEEGLSYDDTKHILEGFGSRVGDLAVIAVQNEIQVGAVFIRYWEEKINMRGYLSEDIPVLVIGVVEEYRRQGIATGLLKAIQSKALEMGILQISLCVSKSNIAYPLYLKNQFNVIGEIDSSYNMLWRGERS